MSINIPDPDSAVAKPAAAAAAPISLEWLNIEFASRCNLRCKWCSLDFDKPSVNMDEALLAQTLDELFSTPGFAVGEIALHNGGETLMHPKLPAMLAVIATKRAGRAPFPVVTLLTNGVLLTKPRRMPSCRQVRSIGNWSSFPTAASRSAAPTSTHEGSSAL